MATYAIGDLQGCFDALRGLLSKIRFNPDRDILWLAGDLVNRGPQSLETLRFCFERRDNIVTVLGNHDLHLLALAQGTRAVKRKDTLNAILSAPDRTRLLTWLQQAPLLHVDPAHRTLLAHAGIAPCWTLDQAQALAREVETVLRGDQADLYFEHMYGNKPAAWSDTLTGPARWRTITNYFTRMRLVTARHALDLNFKGTLADTPAGLYPWFSAPHRQAVPYRILFGHWAALNGRTGLTDILCLDTGCVWGNQLSAYCLETGQWFKCSCHG